MDGRYERRLTAPEHEGKSTLSFAHEINNPLETLVNLLYLLESEMTTEKGREYLRLACEELHRICDITHSVLDEYRTSAAFQNTEVSSLLSSLVILYKSRLDSLGITVETRFRTDGRVASYPGALRQAFTNLLMNAADATPRGGTIHLRVAPSHEWRGQMRPGVQITIADNGSGIAKTDQSRILLEQPFSTKGSAGNGAGLSIVNEAVKKHDGVLRLRSRTTPGRSGSVFTIFLPAAHS